MGFRPDLDLSGFIDDYRPWFGGKSLAGTHYVKTEAPEIDITDFEPIPEAVMRQPVSPPPRDEPWKVGNGPETASSDRGLISAKRSFSWDVNGYYRLLGVPWPYVNATKGQLSKAYIAADGNKSHRKTYYLKQLLNAQTRRLYDDMPLGEPYLDDHYVQDALKAKAAAEAGKRTAAGVFTEADQVMDEWGLKMVDEDDAAAIDSAKKDEHSKPRSPDFDPIEWTFAYWLWRSNEISRTGRLAQWQSSVVASLSEAGAKVRFAVGFLGRQPHEYLIGKDGSTWIVYVNERLDPALYEQTAVRAAGALLHDMSTTARQLNPN